MNMTHKMTVAAMLMLSLGAAEANELKLGNQLSVAQVKSLSKQVIPVGKSTLHVVGVSANGTMVANEIGAVGLSHHEVLVSGAKPAAVKGAVQRLGLIPVAASYYDSTGLSSLQFANINDAASARSALASALQGAVVSLPVEYSKVTPR